MSFVNLDQMNFASSNHFEVLKPQEIVVAKSIIQPGMKECLEKFILSSNKSKDREKALEMLASIDNYNKRFNHNNSLVNEYKLKTTLKRPRTACCKKQSTPSFNPFTTAYTEDFPKKTTEETVAVRPPSTENIIVRPNTLKEKDAENEDNVDICNKVAPEHPTKTYSIYNPHSTYINDYCSEDKTNNIKHQSPIRAATASGTRCNNPHPNKAFLVWRFPRETEHKIPFEISLKTKMENNFAQINDDQFNRVMRGTCRSTYQSDYRGGSAPADQFAPYYLHPELKTGKKLEISTQRIDFNQPVNLPMELCVPKNRYSSNKTKNESSKGIIPQVTSKIYMNTIGRKTYDDDINDRTKITSDIQTKSDLGRLHNLRDLERAMRSAGHQSDKETFERVFQKLNEENYKRISFVRKPNYNNGKMSWISSYPGPL